MRFPIAVLASVLPSLYAQQPFLWREPAVARRIDLRAPAGGSKISPRPPYRFVSEEGGGTSPKVLIRDSAGAEWRMKGGLEVHSESFSTRFVSALGYYAETNVFVARGKVESAHNLKRADGFIQPDGAFVNALFELRDPAIRFLPGRDWSWMDNPFVGTAELRGLKVLVMLLSNWDNKDVRDRSMGSNTGIAERRAAAGAELIYFVNDWGQTMGSWGSELKPKNWNCPAYAAQTAAFVQGVSGNIVRFGFSGQHTNLFKQDITTADVRWLVRHLSRIGDDQIRAGLLASGATAADADCFTKALHDRIQSLREVAR